MKKSVLLVAVFPVFLPAVFAGAAEGQNAAWMLHTNALAKTSPVAVPTLPNVLVLGDSISIGYTPFL